MILVDARDSRGYQSTKTMRMIFTSNIAKGITMKGQLCLRRMPLKGKGRIISVSAEGELGRRIRDMGLVPGVEVEVTGRAPLKDPVALRLKDFTLTLRNNEADYITVDMVEA